MISTNHGTSFGDWSGIGRREAEEEKNVSNQTVLFPLRRIQFLHGTCAKISCTFSLLYKKQDKKSWMRLLCPTNSSNYYRDFWAGGKQSKAKSSENYSDGENILWKIVLRSVQNCDDSYDVLLLPHEEILLILYMNLRKYFVKCDFYLYYRQIYSFVWSRPLIGLPFFSIRFLFPPIISPPPKLTSICMKFYVFSNFQETTIMALPYWIVFFYVRPFLFRRFVISDRHFFSLECIEHTGDWDHHQSPRWSVHWACAWKTSQVPSTQVASLRVPTTSGQA